MKQMPTTHVAAVRFRSDSLGLLSVPGHVILLVAISGGRALGVEVKMLLLHYAGASV